MPRALPWTPDQDACLTAFLDKRGATLRKAALELGVSRSFAQRRAKMLNQRTARSLCSRDREDAGAAPLRAGHPITWSAINGMTPILPRYAM
ncbi:hypothetical protein HN018_10890 [Lichenicola cladoniae]|uniref:Uncharacterized protein n=1 Tax=Lichenicola cladoniae TaxID=1484109 RepID=A0A6M8HPX7_9PROT|nr:hypothetical protein [Lichenicola cladoniae]NPD67873.1 hypothetical protein [Acetobacteraceae bacterium]QKE90474.1 hypothetical protein HN018_10890 [Lichenicola cladoniae]